MRIPAAVPPHGSGFLPVPGFRPRGETATFTSKIDKTLRVDFLAPAVGARRKVFRHDDLGVNLQPLAFIEYLLEDVDQAAVLSALGTVLVNIPDPARYALHKLLVYADRLGRNPLKANKDLRQAAAVIELLGEFRRDAVLRHWQDLLDRGPGWRSRARKGIAGLKSLSPGLPLLSELASRAAR